MGGAILAPEAAESCDVAKNSIGEFLIWECRSEMVAYVTEPCDVQVFLPHCGQLDFADEDRNGPDRDQADERGFESI